jgi:hypothetical protein
VLDDGTTVQGSGAIRAWAGSHQARNAP